MEKIIAHAAEAIILREGGKIIKRRIKKSYRIPELDEKLRKLRTRSESKLLEKASKLISVPKLIKSDEKSKEIELEFLDGKKLSENLDNLKDKFEIMEQVGEETAKLHDNNIIHGDLTTSNMILVENKSIKDSQKINNKPAAKTNKSIKQSTGNSKLITDKNNFQVYIIDFGLGYISSRIEDKAVDIHLLKQALEAKHFQNWEKLFSSFLKGYNSKDKTKILEQLKKVEARGRYRKNAH
ncbi:Kae1-associated serine/threonine protein kinase [Candidatus Pacearchaeota archaeon]|nr:Kae1-associated serine/threonine protein kinase [Candidatus Pacearchaeota archaeon]